MRHIPALAVLILTCAAMGQAQSDWWTFGGDAQRSGWERTDSRIKKENVKDFQLLLHMKLPGAQSPMSLVPPVIIGRLISYRGFKELAFLGGTGDHLYAINADLGNMFFEKQLIYSSDLPQANDKSWACGAAVAPPTMLTPSFSAAPPRGAAAKAAAARAAAANQPPLTTGNPPRPVVSTNDAPAPGGRGPGGPPRAPAGGGFGAPRPVYVVASDGRLHRLNTANGDESLPTLHFLPPNARAGALNMADNVLYTTTNQGCGTVPNAVWALDLSETDPRPKSATFASGLWGIGGVALGTDNTVYAQTGDSLVALKPKDLALLHEFTPPGASSASRSAGMNAPTPVVFPEDNRDLIVSAAADGRLYLLDSDTFGGPDHNSFLDRTAPLTASTNSPDHGVWGSLATWEIEGTRWVLASVWGPLSNELQPSNGAVPHGSIVAFKVEQKNGKPALTLGWVSRDMPSPQPPVMTNGVVFALSAGEFTRQPQMVWGQTRVDERAKSSSRATLYALDAATGKELYSSGTQVTGPAALTGLTVTNGRAYFGGLDGTFYSFGLYMEH